MVDFTNCKEVFNNYSGSEKKKTLVYENKKYLVKFPDPIREKGKTISYINNAYSEYIGSNIFRLCGFDVQNTILGTYNYQGKNKIVCACEDFTNLYANLSEFENLALSFNPNKKIDTELSDIIDVLKASDNLINYLPIKEKFFDMFIIDTLIGNTDRHNGNWGFMYDAKSEQITFSPIYDCGSCLNPLLDDLEIAKMKEDEFKNLAFNTHSCLKENGKKINCIPYLKSMKNNDCNEAIKRVFGKIKINEINDFLDDITCISDIRRDFYKKIINRRYLEIKNIYNNLNNI